jgi:alkaline phosphatase
MFTVTYPDTRSAFAHVHGRDCGAVSVAGAENNGDQSNGKPSAPVDVMLGGGRKTDRLQGLNSLKNSALDGLQLHTEAET